MSVRLGLLCAVAVGLAAALTTALLAAGLSIALATAAGAVFAAVISAAGTGWALRPLTTRLQVLTDGLNGLRTGHFGLSVAAPTRGPLRPVALAYNALSEQLRRDHAGTHQHAQLLESVMASTPLGLILLDASGRVVFDNAAARQLMTAEAREADPTARQPDSLRGLTLSRLAARAPDPIAEALTNHRTGLLSAMRGGEQDSYQLARTEFVLGGQAHTLLQIQPLTEAFNRQEIQTWKTVIRVISHELNNSLAPISSMAHTARRLAARSTSARADPGLDAALTAIQERTTHLKRFLAEYAAFSRLPPPQKTNVRWPDLVLHLAQACRFRLRGPLPQQPCLLDRAQIEQAVINLVRNAGESGAAPESVELQVLAKAGGQTVCVRDRGPGMSEEKMAQALLPFYTTKPGGTGLGLALCRDIAQAHGGQIALINRPGGGLEAQLWLPQRPEHDHTGVTPGR